MIGALLEDYPLLLDATVLEPNRGLAEISTGCINAIVIIIIIIVVVVVVESICPKITHTETSQNMDKMKQSTQTH